MSISVEFLAISALFAAIFSTFCITFKKHSRGTIPFPAFRRICYLVLDKGIAGVAELVDAADLKSAGA